FCLAACAIQDRKGTDGSDHLEGISMRDGCCVQNGIFQNFSIDSSKAEHDNGPKGRINVPTDNRLHTAADHLCDSDAADLGIWYRPSSIFSYTRKCLPHFLCIR